MAFYRLANLERVGVVMDDAPRPAVVGERMELGYYRYPPGTRKPPHRHPEEQIVAVIRGKLAYRVGDESKVLGPGDAVHIPADVDHENWSLDEEVEFVSCKNR
ncbi:MAG TPA: cupin domain-containing protein [Burkholderiales bacterium]|nr:cupin domain-containing protein [Burkholderiales bacterium]